MMKHEVFWKNPGYNGYPTLKKDIECDYLIVGGGIAGVSLAYFLSRFKAGKIVLIEKNTVASGATGKAAGSLVIRGERDFHNFVEKLGKKNATLYWNEIHKTLRLIRKIIEEEKIDCDVEPQDTLYCGFKHKSFNNLEEEYRYEREIENGSRMLYGEDLKKEFNTDLYDRALLSKNHGLSVNPLKLTQNLSKVAARYGASIYENTKFIGENKKIAR